jgi:hypothetical protein
MNQGVGSFFKNQQDQADQALVPPLAEIGSKETMP